MHFLPMCDECKESNIVVSGSDSIFPHLANFVLAATETSSENPLINICTVEAAFTVCLSFDYLCGNEPTLEET